jgi:hypothetical protein
VTVQLSLPAAWVVQVPVTRKTEVRCNMTPHTVGLEHSTTQLFHQSTPACTRQAPSHTAVLCRVSRSGHTPKGSGWHISLPKDLLLVNSAFLDTEVLHRTYTGRTLQSRAPHSSACSSAALASASSAASGSLRDACFSASDIASFIVRTVLSLLQQPSPTHHTRPRLTVSAPLSCAKRDFEGGDT